MSIGRHGQQYCCFTCNTTCSNARPTSCAFELATLNAVLTNLVSTNMAEGLAKLGVKAHGAGSGDT